MKKALLLAVTFLLISCTGSAPDKEILTKDTHAFDVLVGQFANNVENIWGRQEVLIAGPKDYVKYTDNYRTRSHINFEAGVITVETLNEDSTARQLRQSIISTLLMGDDPTSIDLYSDSNDIQISKEPFLFGQVLDEEGQPIRWEWRATRFADYLLDRQLKKRNSGGHTIWSITIALVPNHLDKRAHKYLPMIRKAAAKYHVDTSLILAIMHVESSFNPYAVSRSDALGLMQIMQNTAGRDVFQQQGRWGVPSRSYLFDPENNIDIGVAYLAMLQQTYLVGINNATSRRYAVISAYNGGAGSVLRIFHADKGKAATIINGMNPDDVYQTLLTRHPSQEARNYLQKVNTMQKSYRQL